MAIIRVTDKRIGVTYVYESESYYDREKKQPRCRRHLIGKIDPETGEMVPTGKRGPKAKEPDPSSLAGEGDPLRRAYEEALASIGDKDRRIAELETELCALRREYSSYRKTVERTLGKLLGREDAT